MTNAIGFHEDSVTPSGETTGDVVIPGGDVAGDELIPLEPALE